MSDSAAEETSTIDEKKETSSSNNSLPNYTKFAKSLLIVVLVVVYFCISSYVLMLCKIAQTNILPTDVGCFPYTSNLPKLAADVPTNIFTMTAEDDSEKSMKLSIPYEWNKTYNIFDTMRKYKEGKKSFFLIQYFIAIFESVASSNFAIFNYIFNALNQVPELWVVLFGPLVLGTVTSVVTVINFVFIFFYWWWYHMSWFFKRNGDGNGDGGAWENVELASSPVDFACGVALCVVFAIVLFVCVPSVIWFSWMTVLFVLLCLASMSANFSTNETKKIGLTAIIMQLFSFHKISIVSVLCIVIVASAFSNLGNVPGLIAFAIVVLMVLRIIPNQLFQAGDFAAKLSAVTDMKQATKDCSATLSESKSKSSHGWFYRLISLFFGGGGGGSSSPSQSGGGSGSGGIYKNMSIAKALKKLNAKHRV